MTFPTALTHDAIVPSQLNPRSTFDEEHLAELARSIAADGVLQNLTVRPAAGEEGKYEIAMGERRWRAIGLLVAGHPELPAAIAGVPAAEYPIPVTVRELSDLDLLRLATVENVQRQDMHPMDEADAYARLIEGGVDTETIARETGMTVRHVQLRIELSTKLAKKVKQAFRDGGVTLAQARVLTKAPAAKQGEALKHIEEGRHGYVTADQLRHQLLGKAMPAANALFDLAAYDGDRMTDERGADILLDWPLAERLQREALEARRAELANEHGWCEIFQGYYPWSAYHDARKGEPAGAVLMIDGSDLTIAEIKTGVVRAADRAAAEKAAEEKRNAKLRAQGKEPEKPLSPVAEAKAKNGGFGAGHLAYARQRRTQALQTAVAANGKAAIALACLGLLGVSEVAIKTHDAPMGADDRGVIGLTLDAQTTAKDIGLPPEGHYYDRNDKKAAKAFRALVAMEWDRLFAFHAALVARQVGTWCGYRAELADSDLAAAIAEETGAQEELRRGWTIDEAYTAGLTKADLLALADDLCLVAPPYPVNPETGAQIVELEAPDVSTPAARARMKTADLKAWLPKHPGAAGFLPAEMAFGTKAETTKRIKDRAAWAQQEAERINGATAPEPQPEAEPVRLTPRQRKTLITMAKKDATLFRRKGQTGWSLFDGPALNAPQVDALRAGGLVSDVAAADLPKEANAAVVITPAGRAAVSQQKEARA